MNDKLVKYLLMLYARDSFTSHYIPRQNLCFNKQIHLANNKLLYREKASHRSQSIKVIIISIKKEIY